MRASRRAAATILSLWALPWVPAAEAELRTVGLSGRQLKAWKAIVAVVLATDPDGQPLHPTLHRLWHEVHSSRHVVRIELPRRRLTTSIAGRFQIHSQSPDGRLAATITLDLRVIDRGHAGSPDEPRVPFAVAGRAERRAQVLGHELAHAAWAFAAPDRARLVIFADATAARLAEVARTAGTGGPGFSEQVETLERLVKRLETPALAAEAAIARELRDPGAAYRRASSSR